MKRDEQRVEMEAAFTSWVAHRPEWDWLVPFLERDAVGALVASHLGGPVLQAAGFRGADGYCWEKHFWRPQGGQRTLRIHAAEQGEWWTYAGDKWLFHGDLHGAIQAAAIYARQEKWASAEAAVSVGFKVTLGDKVLLVHPTGAPWQGSYSLPKGLVEGDEEWVDRALTEVKEEVGLDLRNMATGLKPRDVKLVECRDDAGKLLKTIAYWEVPLDDWIGVSGGSRDDDPGFQVPEEIPRAQLQLAEVDWAGFLPREEALLRIAPAQSQIMRA